MQHSFDSRGRPTMITTRKQRPPSLSTTVREVGLSIESPSLDIYEYDSPTFTKTGPRFPEEDDEMTTMDLEPRTVTEHEPDTPGRGGAGSAARSLSTSCFAVPIKYLSLSFLIVQNSAMAMLMRQSRASPAEKLFLPSTVVCIPRVH